MTSLDPSAALPNDPAPSPAPAELPGAAALAHAATLPQTARPRWQSFLLWLAGSGLVSALTAWLAFQIKLTGRAPEVLFPIGVGLALGFALVKVLRYSGFSAGRSAVAMAILWGILVVLGQEYLAHAEHLRNYFDVQNRPNVSAFARLAAGELPPPGFAADLAIDIRERGAGPWSFDAVATVLSAVIVMAWHARWQARASRAGASANGHAATGPAINLFNAKGPGRPTDQEQLDEDS
jgi:hypothetical protein